MTALLRIPGADCDDTRAAGAPFRLPDFARPGDIALEADDTRDQYSRRKLDPRHSRNGCAPHGAGPSAAKANSARLDDSCRVNPSLIAAVKFP